MFTVKQVFENHNYHSYSVDSYFVDRNPPRGATLEGSVPDPDKANLELCVETDPSKVDPDPDKRPVIYPRVSLFLPNGHVTVVEVGAAGAVYVENSQGKTIDVIRPYLPAGMAKHD